MWISQEEEVLLLAFRQETQIFFFIKWGFIDETFCKGSSSSWAACRNKESSCEQLLGTNRGSRKKANKKWKKPMEFCWVGLVSFGFVFFFLGCLVLGFCLFAYFIVYILKVFRNVPSPSSEQILCQPCKCFFWTYTNLQRTGKWWGCHWVSFTMLWTPIWPSPFHCQSPPSKPSCWSLRGPCTPASPGNALSVSDVNNVALICQVTSGLSVEAKEHHLWKCWP